MNRYDALQHAVRAHNSDTDWGGQLYVLHPMAVADRVERHWDEFPWSRVPGAACYMTPPPGADVESAIIVALLHDVLEDTKYMIDPDDLTAHQWTALQLVTRYPDETYFDYVRAIAQAVDTALGPLAAVVKLADLSHNMSDERKVGLTDAQLEQAAGLTEKRYIPSRDLLWEALGFEWWPA